MNSVPLSVEGAAIGFRHTTSCHPEAAMQVTGV
jgi:hypothetical protein